jgi:hypothetical protein
MHVLECPALRTRLIASVAIGVFAAFECFQPPTEAAARARYDYYLTGDGANSTGDDDRGLMLMGGGPMSMRRARSIYRRGAESTVRVTRSLPMPAS